MLDLIIKVPALKDLSAQLAECWSHKNKTLIIYNV